MRFYQILSRVVFLVGCFLRYGRHFSKSKSRSDETFDDQWRFCKDWYALSFFWRAPFFIFVVWFLPKLFRVPIFIISQDFFLIRRKLPIETFYFLDFSRAFYHLRPSFYFSRAIFKLSKTKTPSKINHFPFITKLLHNPSIT